MLLRPNNILQKRCTCRNFITPLIIYSSIGTKSGHSNTGVTISCFTTKLYKALAFGQFFSIFKTSNFLQEKHKQKSLCLPLRSERTKPLFHDASNAHIFYSYFLLFYSFVFIFQSEFICLKISVLVSLARSNARTIISRDPRLLFLELMKLSKCLIFSWKDSQISPKFTVYLRGT